MRWKINFPNTRFKFTAIVLMLNTLLLGHPVSLSPIVQKVCLKLIKLEAQSP